MLESDHAVSVRSERVSISSGLQGIANENVGSGSVITCCPQTSMMFDYGVADMQPDSHPIVLSCIESLEEFVGGFGCEAASDIFDA